MHARSTITAALAAAALILIAPAAQAATVDRFDRSAFDSSPVVTGSGYTMSGATSGELGGYLSLSVQASDGTLPAQGECETADVQAVLTVAPGESFTINTTGELCSHFIDGTPTLNAYFGAKQVTTQAPTSTLASPTESSASRTASSAPRARSACRSVGEQHRAGGRTRAARPLRGRTSLRRQRVSARAFEKRGTPSPDLGFGDGAPRRGVIDHPR